MRALNDLKRTKVGPYEVLSVLGAGAMGIIYTAYDPRLDRQVALKLLRAEGDVGAQAQLVREGQVMARLSHPNVLPIYDIGQHGNAVYFAMELVRGFPLDRWVAQKPRRWEEVRDVFLQAGRGLLAAHRAGLVHRDFKPANVLVGEDGRARVADFGVAATAQDLGPTGKMVGTPAYMAPEQFAGAPTSPATDQFGFCVALYECLYAQRPFAGATVAELAEAVATSSPAAPPAATQVPAFIHRALEQGLRADPAQRHASMATLLAALAKDPVRLGRQRLVAAAALATLALGIGAAVVLPGRTQGCRAVPTRLDGVWDATVARQAERAFAATKKPYAAASWAHARAALDAYAQRWTAARVDACEAHRDTDCLERRFDELAALASAFATADVGVVDQAARAVAGLSPIEACTRAAARPAGPSPSFAALSQAAVVRQQLAQARALTATGRFGPARTKIEPALAQAAALGLPALRAEAELTLGELELERQEWAPARAALERAARYAASAGDDLLAARALARLVSLIGWRLERPAEGRTVAALALGTLEGAGGDPGIEARLAESVGDCEWQAGQRPEALEAYRRSLALRIAQDGAKTVDAARLRSAIAWVLTEQGALDEAKAELDASRAIREELLGPDHPSLSMMWNELGFLAYSRGDTEESVADMRRALSIEQLAFDDDSITVARRRLALASPLGELGHIDEALALVAQIDAALARHPDAPALTRIQVRRVEAELLNWKGRPADALKPARDALTLAEEAWGAAHPYTANTGTVLAHSYAALGRHAEALALLDRYVATETKHGGLQLQLAITQADAAESLMALGRLADAKARLDEAELLLPKGKGNPTLTKRLADLRAAISKRR